MSKNNPNEASDKAAQHGTTPASLPRPSLGIVAAKPGLPLEGGELDLLANIDVDFPELEVDRKPLNLSLVIDRSGSMSGEPLEGAKRAAQTAVGMLIPGDWVSVVTFDGHVEVPVGVVQVTDDRRQIMAAIAAINVRGSTNLYGGWAEGLSQVMACPATDVISRVVLLSDGRANVGVTDRSAIAADVAQASGHGVTTTAMGLGRGYDEVLLSAIADAGRGNYVFLEDGSVTVEAFQQELAGLSALRGRRVRLSAEPGAKVTLAYAPGAGQVASGLRADEAGLMLPDLVAGMPADLLVTMTLQPGVKAVSLTLSWDDAITGQHDQAKLALDLPPLNAAAFAAAPLDDRVRVARLTQSLAHVKAELALAAGRGERDAIDGHIDTLAKLISELPIGEERQREEQELQQLRNWVQQQDHAMTSRASAQFSRDRFRGASKEKRHVMFEKEMKLRMLKGQVYQEHVRGADHNDGQVLFQQELTRPAGDVTTVQVVLGDITKQRVDAIVNSTSRGLMGAAGVDGAITRTGGLELAAAMRAIGSLDYGKAVFTPGFMLPASFVIHTAAQPWRGEQGQIDVLERCYEAVFTLAAQLGVRSIAIPAIGTGHYGYPAELAAQVAARAAERWLSGHGLLDLMRIVVFDGETAAAYLKVADALRPAA